MKYLCLQLSVAISVFYITASCVSRVFVVQCGTIFYVEMLTNCMNFVVIAVAANNVCRVYS